MSEEIGKTALRRCIAILGSQSAVGKIVGRRQTAVSECLLYGKRIPAEWCIPLERATEMAGEKISRHELRPDLYPVETTGAVSVPPVPNNDSAGAKAAA